MRVLAALALLLAAALPAFAGTPAPGLGGALGAPAFWQAYRAAFVSPGGRVVDNGNGGISHSEGQGYAMLLAVAADDRATFDSLWAWTRAELMLRPDGLAAWRWDPNATPHVTDANNATDGDLLIAWALAEAGERWNAGAYRTAALQLAAAIGTAAIAPTPAGPAFRPGVAGYGPGERPDGPVVNLSYWVFPALRRLAAVAPDRPWIETAKTGLSVLAKARFGAAGLPSDWVSLAGEAPRPAQGLPATFGYDAIRIPLYLVWAGLDTPDNLAPFAAAWAKRDVAPRRVDLATDAALEPLDDSGYRAVAALVRCAVSGERIGLDLAAPTVDRYFPTTLRAFVLIAARQRYPQCL